MMALAPQALYSRRLAEMHEIRAGIRGSSVSGPGDITDYRSIWERAAQAVGIIDPEYRETRAVLRDLQRMRAERIR